MEIPNYLRLAPNRVWRTYLGGKTLDRIAGKTVCEDTHFPEEWILSTTRAINAGRENIVEGPSQVIKDNEIVPLQGFIDADADSLFGKRGANPGFLLKYLDSSIRLHLQCHPTIPFAQKYLNSNSGKSEGYYILNVRPEAEGYIYLGFQHAPTAPELREMIVHQDIAKLLSCFEKIPVKRGDAFFVPGGLPHAIGEGVMMVEIMEPTDFAVRIEFERGGYVLPESARFMNRGVDFAVSMFDLHSYSVHEIKEKFFAVPQKLEISGGGEYMSLIDKRNTSCFRLERLTVHGKAALDLHDDFRVVLVTRGSGKLTADGVPGELKEFDRILLPAKTKHVEFESPDMELVLARGPEE